MHTSSNLARKSKRGEEGVRRGTGRGREREMDGRGKEQVSELVSERESFK